MPVTVDQVKQKFAERGYILLETFYVNSKTKMKYLCPKHGVKSITFNGLQNGKGCRECGYEKRKPRKGKYKVSKGRLYHIWFGMLGRCYNPRLSYYKHYGGRGITVCDEWLSNPNSFFEWALTHGYDDNLSIDRINNDASYSPENCRWTSISAQQNNKRTNNLVTIDGVTKSQLEWCRYLKISHQLMAYRLTSKYYERHGIDVKVEKREDSGGL